MRARKLVALTFALRCATCASARTATPGGVAIVDVVSDDGAPLRDP